MLSIYGAGTILGAGIYVLIGKVAGEAGYWLPLAFVVAALAAAINALTYAELASRQPKAGGPVAYVEKAFAQPWLTQLLAWMIVTTGVVSAATITSGFAGYVGYFIDLAQWWPKTLLLVILGSLAARGARASAWFMAITTSLGVIGLLMVIWAAMTTGAATALSDYRESVPPLFQLDELTAILAAAFLAFYAFIGFEDMVHLAEEVRRPQRTMPMAIGAAIATVVLLYVAVSVAALTLATPEELATSGAPLVTAVERGGLPGWPLALLSLWIIANGALAQIVMASRVIYGLGRRRGVPAALGRVNARTGTPMPATLAVTAIAVSLALFFQLEVLAAATSFVMLLVFALSNLALIRLKRHRPQAPFNLPAIVPWVGLAVSIALTLGRVLLGGAGP